jgi:hypothetical protein
MDGEGVMLGGGGWEDTSRRNMNPDLLIDQVEIMAVMC